MCRGRRDESIRRHATIRQPRIAEATRPVRTATAALAAMADIAATASRLTDDPPAHRTAVVAAIRRRRRIAQVRSEATTAAPDPMAALVRTAVPVDTRAAALTEAAGAKPNSILTNAARTGGVSFSRVTAPRRSQLRLYSQPILCILRVSSSRSIH
jgi:hypothetical protein